MSIYESIVTVHLLDRTKKDSVKASVQPTKIYIPDVTIKIEDGCKIERTLASCGSVETYKVIHAYCRCGHGSHLDHWELEVQPY